MLDYKLSSNVGRQPIRDVFTRIIPTADRDDDVLRPIHAVCHGGTALWRGHQYGADFFTSRFVVCAQHCSARVLRSRRYLRIADDDERFRHKQTDASALSGLGNVHSSQRGVVSDGVGCVAMRNLPHEFTLVEIDRRHHTVRRLYER